MLLGPLAPIADPVAAVAMAGNGRAVAAWHTERHLVAARRGGRPPNIILVTTDDQTAYDMRWMPKTRKLLGGHGITFTRSLSPAPLCCPARAEIVTGQYGHNNGVTHNHGPSGGFHALEHKGNTLGAWLTDAGYQTALIGKYLNGYTAANPRQPGWTHWNPSVAGIYNYVGTTFDNDGRLRRFDRNVTPVISRYTTRYIREFATTGKPFFIWASHLPPHGRAGKDKNGELSFSPPLATVEHRKVLTGVRSPSFANPTFNVRTKRPQPYPSETLHEVSRRRTQAEFTGRIQALQDVDDAVQGIVRTLRATGQLARTYIMFTSDNGMLLGEHRLAGKNWLYQEALRVPLVVRSPDIRGARTSLLPATTVDLAPTIVDLAGATAKRVTDGRSFAPLLRGNKVAWRDTQLVQTGTATSRGPQPGWAFRGVWTHRYTFMRRVGDGAVFLFDRKRHPHEGVNVAPDRSYRAVLRALRNRHDALIRCRGTTCNRRFGKLPDPRRPKSDRALTDADHSASARSSPR